MVFPEFDDDETDTAPAGQGPAGADESGGRPDYEAEIIMLLRDVGQRLAESEKERKQMRRSLRDLNEKADQGERAFLTVQDRLYKSEATFEKRHKALQKAQDEQFARIEQAAALADKMEAALAEYAKINRRLDKVTQEKARMLRKLERIEETVIDTQEAVQTAAISHLGAGEPPHGADSRSKIRLPQAPDTDDEGMNERPWWQQHGPVRTATVAAMILLGIAGGWAISHLQLREPGTPQLARFNATPGQMLSDASGVGTPPPSFPALPAYEEPPPASEQRFTRAIEGALAYGETETTSEDARPTAEKSPLEMSDEELLASLDEDPAALAAQLNEIAPAAATPPEDLNDAAPTPAPPGKPETTSAPQARPAAFTAGETREVDAGDFIAAQTNQAPISARIDPDPDLPPVIKEVETKAFEGVAEAQHDLAAIYTAGHGGVDVNYERAALWFRESAVNGVGNARYNLGVLYHQGLGVEENINTAVNWYRAAADMGHPEAQYNLGIAYIEGIGTRYNPEEAARQFEQAAGQGIMEAAYNLGLIHENGLTGNSRPDEALYWYKQAADMGSPEAQMALDQLAKTLGLFPEEVERLYGQREADDKAQAPAAPDSAAATARRAAAVAPAAGTQDNERDSGVEYIEAGPLNPSPEKTTANAGGLPLADAVPAPSEPTAPAASPAVIAQIQEQLIRFGLYPGPADGVNDPVTADAIRAYQSHHDIQQDGRASEALLVHMLTSELDTPLEYGSRAE